MTKRIVAIFASLLIFSTANAALEQGEYLGTFSGNDSEAALLAELGVVVSLLAKVDIPDTSYGGLEITNLVYNYDNEPIAGEWYYAGPEVVTYIVIKAGPEYAVYDYSGVAMINMGIWDTSALDNKGLSHITAYSTTVIPVPAPLLLLGSGLLGLGLIRRR